MEKNSIFHRMVLYADEKINQFCYVREGNQKVWKEEVLIINKAQDINLNTALKISSSYMTWFSRENVPIKRLKRLMEFRKVR